LPPIKGDGAFTDANPDVMLTDTTGFPDAYPRGLGEKIICLKNRHDLALVNGMFLDLSGIHDESPLAFSTSVRAEDGTRCCDTLRKTF
jgi:hypothetical protein